MSWRRKGGRLLRPRKPSLKQPQYKTRIAKPKAAPAWKAVDGPWQGHTLYFNDYTATLRVRSVGCLFRYVARGAGTCVVEYPRLARELWAPA